MDVGVEIHLDNGNGIIILFTVPVTFFLSRLIIKGNHEVS